MASTVTGLTLVRAGSSGSAPPSQSRRGGIKALFQLQLSPAAARFAASCSHPRPSHLQLPVRNGLPLASKGRAVLHCQIALHPQLRVRFEVPGVERGLQGGAGVAPGLNLASRGDFVCQLPSRPTPKQGQKWPLSSARSCCTGLPGSSPSNELPWNLLLQGLFL